MQRGVSRRIPNAQTVVDEKPSRNRREATGPGGFVEINVFAVVNGGHLGCIGRFRQSQSPKVFNRLSVCQAML
jgi:hypothetical protein